MTLVMSCRCLSQSYVGRSIGGECVLSVNELRRTQCEGGEEDAEECVHSVQYCTNAERSIIYLSCEVA